MDNLETQTTLDTRHRTRTGNEEWTIQRHRQHQAQDTERGREMKNGQSRDIDNIRDKTQNEDQQNKQYNTEN